MSASVFQTDFARLDGAGLLNHNGFNDKASSHRICLEPTTYFSLYENEDLEELIWHIWPQLGTGYHSRVNFGTFEANDVATSAQFRTFEAFLAVQQDRAEGIKILAAATGLSTQEVESRLAVPEVEWDLDGDGNFEIRGGESEIEQTIVFEASALGETRIRARRRGIGTDVNGDPVEFVIRVVPAD